MPGSGGAVESAINSFQVATTKISLKGLSAEDQQKEIEAVFSQIFDNLSVAVVPFLKEFQKTGEGYGETLARISIEVATADFAVKNLGVSLGDKLANPELYARISDNLATLAGGVEEFANKTASFVDSFAPDSIKLAMYSDALTEQLSAVGLSMPQSTDAFFALMQTLDGTTEAGQEQIATLLNLQDSASGYYNLLEKENEQYVTLSSSLRGVISTVYGLSKAAASVALDSALAGARVGEFSAALDGDFSSAMPDIGDFSSLSDFMLEQAVTANKLEELAALSDGQISIEERQLSELEKINQSIRESYSPQNASSGTIEETSGKQLEDISLIKYANQSIAESVARAAKILDRIEGGGSILSVRVEQ